jgi:hypothetical protein
MRQHTSAYVSIRHLRLQQDKLQKPIRHPSTSISVYVSVRQRISVMHLRLQLVFRLQQDKLQTTRQVAETDPSSLHVHLYRQLHTYLLPLLYSLFMHLTLHHN